MAGLWSGTVPWFIGGSLVDAHGGRGLATSLAPFSKGTSPLYESASPMTSLPPKAITPGEGNGNPLQYSCLGNSMVGFSPWGRQEPDTTEHTVPAHWG